MVKKLKAILGSVRFWIVTLTAVIAVLELAVSGTFSLAEVMGIVQVWLGVVAGIGTLDSVGKSFAGKKK